MADPATIMARIRKHGANVVIDDGRLKIMNGKKLPAGALEYIKQHGRAIADWLEAEAEFEERAAIIEFDGGTPRAWAEEFARILISKRPEGVSDLDWSWFISSAGKIVDEAPARAA